MKTKPWITVCTFSLCISMNSSGLLHQTQFHISINIRIKVQLPPVLCLTLSPHTSGLHPVNHGPQIAPWSQSTLKWWKWIKLITDSQCESWPRIKSCVLSAAVHPSYAYMLYGGETWSGSHCLSVPVFINPPHLQNPLPPPPVYLMHLVLSGI